MTLIKVDWAQWALPANCLEDVQNVALRSPALRLQESEPYLGEQSTRDWHRLIAVWSGQTPP
jgi:hypothetical protein